VCGCTLCALDLRRRGWSVQTGTRVYRIWFHPANPFRDPQCHATAYTPAAPRITSPIHDVCDRHHQLTHRVVGCCYMDIRSKARTQYTDAGCAFHGGRQHSCGMVADMGSGIHSVRHSELIRATSGAPDLRFYGRILNYTTEYSDQSKDLSISAHLRKFTQVDQKVGPHKRGA